MSLVKKIKDILFEEEEYTEPIKIREEKKEEVVSTPVTSTPQVPISKSEFENTVEPKMPEITRENDLLKADNTFKFPDFDEEEFQSSMSRSRQNTNVLDIERKKKMEKRNDYSRYDRGDNRETSKEYTEKKKFKPSPIISPVYGILNQDYRADEIVNKSDVINNVDIDSVRKKAFETIKEEPKRVVSEPISEPVVTFFEEKDNVPRKEETKEEYKNIDTLLEEASTEISLEDTLEIPTTNNLEAIEEELEKIEEEKIDKPNIDKEEKESDIFELIDSMYENRKEDN